MRNKTRLYWTARTYPPGPRGGPGPDRRVAVRIRVTPQPPLFDFAGHCRRSSAHIQPGFTPFVIDYTVSYVVSMKRKLITVLQL